MRRRRTVSLALLLAAFVLAGVPRRAGADGDDAPPLPEGVVARAGGVEVTYAELCRSVVDLTRAELRTWASPVAHVLRQMIEERAVLHAMRARGLEAGEDGVAERIRVLEAEFQERFGVRRSLKEVLADQGLGERAFRRRIRLQIATERLAALGVEVEALVRDAEVRLGVATSDAPHPTLSDLEVVATVDGEVISTLAFGERLVEELDALRVRDLLDKTCRSEFVAAQGHRLSADEMRAEIAYLNSLWRLERQFDPEDVWETVVLHSGEAANADPTTAELIGSPYHRSLFGLVRHLREAVTERDMREAWRARSSTTYGPHFEVLHLEIAFGRPQDPFGDQPTRVRREALELARELRRAVNEGHPFDALAADLESRGDATIRVFRGNVYPTSHGALVYEACAGLADGEVSAPFETLAEVNVVQRISGHLPWSYEDVAELVRERLARERARTWLEDSASNGTAIQVRWPLPQRD